MVHVSSLLVVFFLVLIKYYFFLNKLLLTLTPVENKSFQIKSNQLNKLVNTCNLQKKPALKSFALLFYKREKERRIQRATCTES